MRCALAILPANRSLRYGCWLAGIYLAGVVAIYILTWLTTKPDNVGLDWIPFVMLAMPWYRMAQELLFPGFLINAALLFGIGALIGSARKLD